MAPDELPDLHKAIERTAARTTLHDLAKQGFRNVRVLDEAKIRQLIEDAVRQTISRAGGKLGEAERQKIVQDSRQELDRLMKQFRGAQDQAQIVEQSKNQLVEQVQNLQKQLELQRKLTDQAREDGRHAALGEQRKVIEEERKKGYDEGVASQKSLCGFLERQTKELEKDNRELREKMHQAELGHAEAEKKEAQALFAMVEKLFTKMEETISRKLQNLRVAGAGVGAGDEYPDKPGALMLDSVFKTELESNLKNIGVDQKTAGKIDNAVERLRAMRAAKQAPPKEGDGKT